MSIHVRRTVAVALLTITASAACGLPRDPDGTLARVRNGTMRVGVIDGPPWARATDTSRAGAIPGGVEPALVQEFARELHARVRWVPGSAPELLAALEHGELDLLVGGFTESTPWRRRLAMTNAFYVDSVVVGVAPGASPLHDLAGARVAVALGDPTARYVRDEGGTPVVVERLTADVVDAAALPVATSAWRLPALRRARSAIVLHQARHVMLLPRGENGWLVRLERFLRERRSAVQPLLQQELPRAARQPAVTTP